MMQESLLPISRRSALAGIGGATLAPALLAAGSAPPLASTKYGRVIGFYRNGAAVFLGIPYGASTAGPRRFLPPSPPRPWGGIRGAVRYGQRAPQASNPNAEDSPLSAYFTGGRRSELDTLGDSQMGEDCLVLNILTPAADSGRRPVLVYIHGGGFVSGSGNVMALSDRLVVEEDVVLVTLNHRLGAFGFLYLGGLDPRFAQGNPGMLDLVAALEWVRANIAAFGGDPDRVTVFGESGGGIKIAILTAMPQARGLFRSAIVQSGLMPSFAPADDAIAEQVMRNLDIPARSAAALQNVPAEALLTAGGGSVVTRPCADGHTLADNLWAQAPESGHSVSMIIGYCADELTLFAAEEFRPSLGWNDIPLRLQFRFPASASAFAPVVDAYRHVHRRASPAQIYSRMMSDATFGRDMVTLADRKASQRPPVYFYRMEYMSSLAPQFRSFHTIELPLTGRLVAEPRAEPLSRSLAGAWAAFARSENPNHASMPHWHARPVRGAGTMLFGETSHFGPDPQSTPHYQLMSLVGSRPMDLRPGHLLPAWAS